MLQFLDGFNVSLLTLGQTESGKTFLLHGPKANRQGSGLLSNISSNLFNNIDKKISDCGYHYGGVSKVGIQSFEIYSELARDLLDPSRDGLDIEMDESEGPLVRGLSTKWVSNHHELNQWIGLVRLRVHTHTCIGAIESSRRKQ